MKNFWLFFIWFTSSVHAQFNFAYNPNIPVSVGGNLIENPWAGGLNYTQISDFDFDFDGDLDLFIFDRSSNNIRVFTQEGDPSNLHYRYVHNSKTFFPGGIIYKALLVDYDMDGNKDLFTYGIGGLKVYRNSGNALTGLQWELVSELLETQYATNNNYLLVSSDDIPAIVDVDYDGDIDILTFHTGGETMEYHQNQSMELYGIPDSLIFEQKNQCWGKFREDPVTSAIILNDPDSPCVGGDISNPQKAPQHAGSTILAYDFDNSGVIDLVLGDVSFTNLSLLLNGGTAPNTDSPMISVDSNFPSNTTPAESSVFPASFLVDVDFDGVKDLLVCPNASIVSENEISILFYKNIGSNEIPNFVYSTNDFLQNEMIDHGLGSMPMFVDLNQDGLKDLIVANLFRYKPVLQKESTLAYYQNIGTANAPSYSLVDNDYLNFSLQSYGLRSIPTFGDLDGDNDQDLLLSLDDGTISYFENITTSGSAIFAAPIPNYLDHAGQVISTNGSSFPQLFDLNDDGLLDLILGKLNGNIRYYENVGTTLSPSFQLMNDTLGNIDISPTNANSFSAPHFFRFEDTTHLFIGEVNGKMIYYTGIDDLLSPGDAFTLVSSDFIDIDAGQYSSFWVEDINSNGSLELYVGQDLGGITRFEHDSLSTVSLIDLETAPKLNVYPNPMSTWIKVESEITQERIEIIDFKGRIVLEQTTKGNATILETHQLEPGVYFLKTYFEKDQISMKKLIKF